MKTIILSGVTSAEEVIVSQSTVKPALLIIIFIAACMCTSIATYCIATSIMKDSIIKETIERIFKDYTVIKKSNEYDEYDDEYLDDDEKEEPSLDFWKSKIKIEGFLNKYNATQPETLPKEEMREILKLFKDLYSEENYDPIIIKAALDYTEICLIYIIYRGGIGDCDIDTIPKLLNADIKFKNDDNLKSAFWSLMGEVDNSKIESVHTSLNLLPREVKHKAQYLIASKLAEDKPIFNYDNTSFTDSFKTSHYIKEAIDDYIDRYNESNEYLYKKEEPISIDIKLKEDSKIKKDKENTDDSDEIDDFDDFLEDDLK